MAFEGTQFGRYKLSQMLGSGAMGEVYLAEDSLIHRQVAIKVVRSQLALYSDEKSNEQAARLFEREMKIISQLDHPYILPLYDYGEVEVNETTITYMVMPYRPEGSLLTWLHQRKLHGLLAPQDVAILIGQAASALYHAHERQIVHQDVKPSNFLMRIRQEEPEHPDLLLTDFGISRFMTAHTSSSQVSGGTPGYMAPEQWEGNPTYASDQYALAVMAYELLTGHLPFEGGPSTIMYKHMTAMPPVPSSLNPALSPAIDAVLLQALAKKPEMRFASIANFASALQQACISEQPTVETSLQNSAKQAIASELASEPSEAESNNPLLMDLSTVTPQANIDVVSEEKQSRLNVAAQFWLGRPIAGPARPRITPTVTRLLVVLALILIGTGGLGLFYFLTAVPNSTKDHRLPSYHTQTVQTKSEATATAIATVRGTIPTSYVQPSTQATDQNTNSSQSVAAQQQATSNTNTNTQETNPKQEATIATPTQATTTGDPSEEPSPTPTPTPVSAQPQPIPTPTPVPVQPTPTPTSVPAQPTPTPTPHPCVSAAVVSNPVYQGNGYAYSNGGTWRTASAYCAGRVYFAFTSRPAVASTQVRICRETNSVCGGWVQFTSVGSKLLIARGLTAGTTFHLQFQSHGATGSYTVHGAVYY